MKKILFAAALAGAAILTACGDKGGGVRMGSLSEFDSLSYVLGANIGNGINFEMRDIPFDFKAIDKGIKEGAMGKATQEHDKSLDMLREYFMSKRDERAQEIAAKRAEQDSIRLAGGDTTKVEYPAADPPCSRARRSVLRFRMLSVTTSVTTSARAVCPYSSYGSVRPCRTCATARRRWPRMP